MQKIFIVSDGTGRTAELALNAALTQFPGIEVNYERRPGIENKQDLLEIVCEAKASQGFIIHTLVSDEMRSYMIRLCRLNNIESIDIMGPFLSRLSNQFAVSPTEKPGLFNQLNEEYFRRVETMNFAFKHDDGLRVEELNQAEIVLIGISRTFKTPLSIYLSFKGWFVANVPIILNMPLPRELSIIPPAKVFCLMTNARKLSELRRVRNERLKEAAGEYASLDYVKKELFYAKRLFDLHPGWRVITVTSKPIEEIASEIIDLL